jgi:hypothetical protein
MKLSRYIFLLAVCLWNSIPLPLRVEMPES